MLSLMKNKYCLFKDGKGWGKGEVGGGGAGTAWSSITDLIYSLLITKIHTFPSLQASIYKFLPPIISQLFLNLIDKFHFFLFCVMLSPKM
jgi:hypothetical protein